jgi:NADH-quinone oxidoreductase subunit J
MDPVSLGLFWLLAVAALVSGVFVVSHRSPVGSVFALIVNSICLAGIYLVLGDSFLAAIQVIVYSGAILVLFLFVIMLLDIRRDELTGAESLARRLAVGLLLASLGILVGLSLYYGLAVAPRGADGVEAGGLFDLADLLFSKYILAFEAVSVLLLAAMVGVVVLTKKDFGPAAGSSAPDGPEKGAA